jgi:hypothetical protein
MHVTQKRLITPTLYIYIYIYMSFEMTYLWFQVSYKMKSKMHRPSPRSEFI